MKKILFLINCIILFSSCNLKESSSISEEKVEADSLVRIFVQKESNLKDRTFLSLGYFNKYNDEIYLLKTEVGFDKTINSKIPIILRDNDRVGQTKYILLPGDSINITTDSNNLLKFNSLNNQNRNKELDFFNQLKLARANSEYYKLGLNITYKGPPNNPEFRDYYISTHYPDKDFVTKYTELKLKENRKFLNDYKKKFNISDHIYSIIDKMFYYDYFVGKIRLANEFLSTKEKIDLKTSKDLDDFNNETKTGKFLFILGFRIAISNYLQYLLKKDNIHLDEKYAYINKKFEGHVKDYLLYNEIKKEVEKQNFDQKSLQFFYANCIDNDFVRDIKEKIELSVPSNQSLLINTNGSKILYKDLLSKSQGKIVFIDFWASWCVPCIQQIPKSLQLENELKSYPIQFYFISLDKNSSSWKDMSSQLKQDPENNYILTNNFNSPLAKSLNIRTIPRYLIIGKNQKIIEADYAMKSEELKKYLLKLAEK